MDSNFPSEVQQYTGYWEKSEILKAEIIYVLLKKSCYISRSLRIQWFLQHLNTKIRITSQREIDEDDLEAIVISVIPQELPKKWSLENSHQYEYLVVLSSNVVFLGEVYRQVYCLDISPSVSTVDTQQGEVLLDVIIEALQKSIKLLIKPFKIPGSSRQFTPDIFITVIAHTPFYISPAQQVLVQGWKISKDNVNEFLEAVLRQIKFIEDAVSQVSGNIHEQFERDWKNITENEIRKSRGAIFNEDVEKSVPLTAISSNIAMVSPGSGFLNLLRYGMLALRLLPVSNFSNLVVITDGMIIMPDSDTLDSVLNHMRYNDIACYFLHVGSQFHPHCSFGFVPYSEIMQLIAVATNGSYMQYPSQHKQVNSLNVYQQNFLTWSLKRKSVIIDLSTPHPRDGEWCITNRHFYGNRGPQLLVKKYLENDINVNLYGVLACRIREGFIVKDFYNRDEELIICLILPWTNHIYIEYSLSCQWPVISTSCISTHYVINIKAPYEFLHDISCPRRVPIKSPFRQALIARFWRSLKSFAQSDLLLSHLESFMNNVSSYYLPESLKNGMPLYYLAQGSSQPTLGSNDPGYSQFGTIWRPACLLNNNLWQKWFHADRVGVIFKHDEPLNLFMQNFEPCSIKCTGLMCRQATNVLFNFLKSYCSFVLIENHTYIKFLLPNESGTGKYSFIVIRSIIKAPYSVLHVAFLYNIPGRVRTKVLREFKRLLEGLKIPRLITQNDSYEKNSTEDKANSYELQLNCCILLDKPLEKILIRYEQMPKEFKTVIFPDGTQPTIKAPKALSSNRGLITTLSRYLHHRRWIWSTSVAQSIFLPTETLEKAVLTLIKIRLQEGFYFAHYCAGICNMVLEVQMKGEIIEKEDVDGNDYDCRNEDDGEDKLQSCIIQYVIFSPKPIISEINDEDEDNNDNSSKIIELVTECWIEPQHGVITDCPPVRNYMSNLQYHQLPDAIWSIDAKCISALFTFEYLQLMCEKSSVKAPNSIQHLLTQSSSSEYWPNVAPFEDQRISQIPFAYSLPNILCQCTQEMLQFNLFSVDILDKTEVSSESNKILLDSIYNYLASVHNKELIISGQDAIYLIKNFRKNFRYSEKHYNNNHETHLQGSELSLSSDVYGTVPSAYDWERLINWALDNSRKSSSTPRSSRTSFMDQKHIKLMDGSYQSSSVDVSSMSYAEDAEWLKWKCYIRFTSKCHCLVTIVPDNLNIIKRIVLGQKETGMLDSLYHDVESDYTDLEDMTASTTAKNDSCSFYTSCSSGKDLHEEQDGFVKRTITTETTFRLRASTWDPMRGTIESRANIDDRLRTNSVGARVRPLTRLRPKRSFDFESRDRLQENMNRMTKYVPCLFPVYVCNCSLSDVIEYLICKHKTMYEESLQNPGYVETNTVNFENIAKENHLADQCKSLTVAFKKYFVLSLFKSLHLGYDVPLVDVEQAFSKCETSVLTIDITDYLKMVCKHLRNYTSSSNTSFQESSDKKDIKSSSFFISSSVCNEFHFIHRLIKKKFVNILTLDFRPIPSKPEFYFFFPTWTKESKPSSVGMLSPGFVENTSDFSADQIGPTSSTSGLGLSNWETCKESVNSEENACTSLLSNMDSDSLNEVSNESLNDDLNPLFLKLECKIYSESKIGRCSVHVIPTCICELLKQLDKPLEINVHDLRVTLDLVCLTSPCVESKKKSSKSKSLNSSPKTTQYVEELDESVAENMSFENGTVPRQVALLPDYQYNALNTCIGQIKWLMKDEIVSFMLDTTPVTRETLKTVCEHIESSSNASTCFIEKVPLLFVFGQDAMSVNSFLQDFDNIKIPNYRLEKTGNTYYFVKNLNERQRFFTKKDHNEHEFPNDLNKVMNSSMEVVNEEQENFFQVFSSDSFSENDSVKGFCIDVCNTSYGYPNDGEEDNPRIMHNMMQWILNRELSNTELPSFWLIMTVTNECVTVYFHCRFLKIKKQEIEDYEAVCESVISKIKNLCKRVNQKMLLDSLHETRICDQLLVPDPQQDDENETSSVTEPQNHTFLPGCFACPIVWETKFLLHPRLKMSPIKGTVSRGIQALCSALSGFSVTNRKNLFVYQDINRNVFYLRLYESIHGNIKHESEETSSASFSRSSSFTSLSRKQFDDQLPFLLDESKLRNKSISESSESNALKNDDFITLKVHGITEAGNDIKNDLVQVLQNRLDDAVLDVISVMLSRNPLCKLLSEDVHFIQKPNQTPNAILQFGIHNWVTNYLHTFRHFVKQNMQAFASLPKYSDPRSSFHFQDYSVPEDSPKRISEWDIFLYNQNPTHGKGIACLAFIFVNANGDPVSYEEKSDFVFEENNETWSLEYLKRITTVKSNAEIGKNDNIRIELRVWRQGSRVNIETLESKFHIALRHALWELVMEKNLLLCPLFAPNSDNLFSIYPTLMPLWMNYGNELNVASAREWEIALPIRSNVDIIFKELNSVFQPHETSCYAFYKQCLYLENSNEKEVYKPCVTFDDVMQHTGDTCLIIGQNLSHPQTGLEIARSLNLETKTDARLQRSPSSSQEEYHVFVAKRKFILIILANSKLKVYIYNWTKDKVEALTKLTTNLSEWLQARRCLLISIVEQKMGIFFNLPIYRPSISKKVIDMSTANIDLLLKFPISPKPGGIQLNATGEIFRDVKLSKTAKSKLDDRNPFVQNVNQLREAVKIERKGNHKQLHNIWQAKASTSNSSISEEMLNNFLLHGRLIHYCLTPLLFMPRWRLKTAATRDHTLSLKTLSEGNEVSLMNEKDEQWHAKICSNFINDYQQYLQSLGFHPVERSSEEFPAASNPKHPLENVISGVRYMQKYLLGGVLLYELFFSEPFFNAKLYALEYERLNTKSSSLISQFTVSFLDECDRIKFQMHLHSFTYDYHLRSLHQFITDQQPSLSYGYHIVNFLEDFMKYYPKAPNYARSLVHTEYISVNVSIPPSQLFDYLLTHRKNYDMSVFCMMPHFTSNDTTEENEYVLIRNKSTSAVCYKDVNDVPQIEDFDITIIVSRINNSLENSLNFQVYIVITSRRELYPKVESEQKLGKFRTVSTSCDPLTSNQEDIDVHFSIYDDSESCKDSSLEHKDIRRKRSSHHVEIKQEPVNYLGYYSSHEEAMQTLMMEEVVDAKKYISWMVTQGTFDCETHILWNKLLCSSPAPLTYQDLQRLLNMADVHEISAIDEQLKKILNQPVSWLQTFIKSLVSKMPEYCHLFPSPSGNTQELLILHPQYANGFVMIVLNLTRSICTMNLVYRRGLSESEEAQSELHSLFEQIINNFCYHLWLDAL